MKHACYLLLALLLFKSCQAFAQITLRTPNIESQLYLGKGERQPLIVGLGGSEGGNAWTSDYWKPTRDQFLEKGYAFLALGYFGANGTPDTLQQIALEDVHRAIEIAIQNPKINKNKIAVVGGSRGGDLALLLSSHYKDISCVVAIVPSNVVFPGHTGHFTTSCWTYEKKELAFVPVNEAAVPFLLQRNLRGAFEAMLQDTVAAQKAAIPIENSNAAILLLSATKDEICPSTPMCEQMMARLEKQQFKRPFAHHAIEGSHAAPLQRFDLVFAFLQEHFD